MPHEDESSDMEHRSGVFRSNLKGAVMLLDGRDGISNLAERVNRLLG